MKLSSAHPFGDVLLGLVAHGVIALRQKGVAVQTSLPLLLSNNSRYLNSFNRRINIRFNFFAINKVRGQAAILAIFVHMFKQVEAPNLLLSAAFCRTTMHFWSEILNFISPGCRSVFADSLICSSNRIIQSVIIAITGMLRMNSTKKSQFWPADALVKAKNA